MIRGNPRMGRDTGRVHQVNVRVILALRQEMMRAGLRSLLLASGIDVVGEASDGPEAVALAHQLSADVAILDDGMAGLNSIDAAGRIAGKGIKVILICMGDILRIEEGLRAGAMGYLTQNSESVELVLAVEAIMRGEVYLTPKVASAVAHGRAGVNASDRKSVFKVLTAREREVLQLLSEGQSNKEMAAHLGLTLKTVETYRAQLMDKLDVHSVAGLTKYAIREGLTTAES